MAVVQLGEREREREECRSRDHITMCKLRLLHVHVVDSGVIPRPSLCTRTYCARVEEGPEDEAKLTVQLHNHNIVHVEQRIF